MFKGIIHKFKKVKNYLSKTSEKLSSSFNSIFKAKKLDTNSLLQLKEVLISTDVDYRTANFLVESLAGSKFDKEITVEEVKFFLAEKIAELTQPLEKKLTIENNPHIIMFCGVNGNGKTTTIAKLAHKFKKKGKSVMVVPCDTFRAAAEEQLDIWAKRIGCEIFIANNTKDPASVAYQAISQAKERGIDVLFIDTAGRLHTNTDLMNELKKIYNVIKKCEPSAPHENILILDATVGQNAFNQITLFKENVDIDGIIITKLDGTAKGGVVVGLAKQFIDLKIYAIGIGESITDLEDFSSKDFAYNLLGISD